MMHRRSQIFQVKKTERMDMFICSCIFLQKVNKTLKSKVFNKKWSVGFDASIQKKGEC